MRTETASSRAHRGALATLRENSHLAVKQKVERQKPIRTGFCSSASCFSPPRCEFALTFTITLSHFFYLRFFLPLFPRVKRIYGRRRRRRIGERIQREFLPIDFYAPVLFSSPIQRLLFTSDAVHLWSVSWLYTCISRSSSLTCRVLILRIRYHRALLGNRPPIFLRVTMQSKTESVCLWVRNKKSHGSSVSRGNRWRALAHVLILKMAYLAPRATFQNTT